MATAVYEQLLQGSASAQTVPDEANQVSLMPQGDQRQGKSGRIREFQSHVFKSGKVRENRPFWIKSGNFIIN